MQVKTTGLTAAFLVTLFSSPISAAPNNLTGSIVGVVSNALGVPQMGATVFLFNRLERQVGKLLTDDRGVFQFDSLPSDVYALRVTLASFVPAFRGNIGLQPGLRKVLSINLAGVLSSIELVYSLPLQQGLMSDDWKWALRGSLATRPILRLASSSDIRDPLRLLRTGNSVFSETRGMVRLSAGDSLSAPTLGSQPDLGTAFALATSIYGANRVEVSGNLGYGSASGNPAAGFRTAFSRQVGDNRSPEVAVTMRQIFLPGRVGSSLIAGQPDSAPAFRSMSVSMSDRVQISENMLFSYGATLESVQFLQRLNYVSPYARLSWDLETLGILELGFSSGLPPTQLYTRPTGNAETDSQQQQFNDLTVFPRVSVRDSQARIQRAQNFEAGMHKTIGKRTYAVAAYREAITNAALTAAGADGAFANGELLPDLFSTSAVFNAGRYHTMGYMASVTQRLSDNWSMNFGYGNSGVLEASRDYLLTNDADELRSVLQTQRRHWATTGMSGYVLQTGTRFSANYQFTNGRGLTPGHFYMTQQMNPQRGLNVQVRQPIPSFSGMPGKIEATAEIRNILAQGYQPFTMADGSRLQLVHSPRALRGGLAFIF